MAYEILTKYDIPNMAAAGPDKIVRLLALSGDDMMPNIQPFSPSLNPGTEEEHKKKR